MAHDVFVSYSSKDKQAADAACAVLESRGIRCWIAPRDILPGADWGQSIIHGISGCKLMVLIFSRHANQSQQVKREVERVVHHGRPIIPVRIEEVLPAQALEYFLSTTHWLDAFAPPLEQHLKQLAAIVQHILMQPAQASLGKVAPVRQQTLMEDSSNVAQRRKNSGARAPCPSARAPRTRNRWLIGGGVGVAVLVLSVVVLTIVFHLKSLAGEKARRDAWEEETSQLGPPITMPVLPKRDGKAQEWEVFLRLPRGVETSPRPQQDTGLAQLYGGLLAKYVGGGTKVGILNVYLGVAIWTAPLFTLGKAEVKLGKVNRRKSLVFVWPSYPE